jgi:hypothetical protein
MYAACTRRTAAEFTGRVGAVSGFSLLLTGVVGEMEREPAVTIWHSSGAGGFSSTTDFDTLRSLVP